MTTTLKQYAGRILLALFALFMAPHAAVAVPLTFEGVTGGLNDYVEVSIPAHGSTPAFSSSGDEQVGFATYQAGSGPLTYSFCMDPYDPSIAKTENYTAVSLTAGPESSLGSVAMGSSAAVTIEKLWAMNYSAAQTSITAAAALQVAIWKAVAESQGGTVTAVEYENQANEMLVDTVSYQGGVPPLFAWSNNHYQDYIGVPDGGVTAALLGLSLAGVAMLRRKYHHA
jgi:hypothetical protein